MSVNKVILIGNVGTVNVRAVGESKVATVSVATSYKTKDHEETEWHNVVAWDKTAEYVEKYITKGSQVYVEGRIRSRRYTDRENVDRIAYEIVADRLNGLDRKAASGAPAGDGMPA